MTRRKSDPLRDAVDRVVREGLADVAARRTRSVRARVCVLIDAMELLERERKQEAAARGAAEATARTLRSQLSGVSLVCDRALRAGLVAPIPMDRDAGPGAVVEAMLVRLDELAQGGPDGGLLVRLAGIIERRCGRLA